MNLSTNFTLEEMTRTDTGLLNIPNDSEKEKLFYLCQFILQPARDACGVLQITSGYRSFEVNQAIGGSETSQHRLGEAADFIPLQESIDTVFYWFKRSGLKWGQLIRENKNGKDWIHISLPRLTKQNQMFMVYENGVYKNI